MTNAEANEIVSFLRTKNTFRSGRSFPPIYAARIGSDYSPFETARNICVSLLQRRDTKFIANELIRCAFFPLQLRPCSKQSKKDELIARWRQSDTVTRTFESSFIRGLRSFVELCREEERRSNTRCEQALLLCLLYVCSALVKEETDAPNYHNESQFRQLIDNAILRYENIYRKMNRASVMTIHQSKGREYDMVIIPWFSNISWTGYHKAYWNANDEQHRNLFHTAYTRARQKVLVMYPPGSPAW